MNKDVLQNEHLFQFMVSKNFGVCLYRCPPFNTRILPRDSEICRKHVYLHGNFIYKG